MSPPFTNCLLSLLYSKPNISLCLAGLANIVLGLHTGNHILNIVLLIIYQMKIFVEKIVSFGNMLEPGKIVFKKVSTLFIFYQLLQNHQSIHRKKRFTSFPSPAGMSLTKLPLGRNTSVMTSLFPPRESMAVTSRLGTGNSRTFFFTVQLSSLASYGT